MTRTLWTLALLLCAAPAACWDDLLVVTTDFASYGAVSSVGRHALWTAATDLETVYSDAVARWRGDVVYVVNRGGPSNIQVLDPSQAMTTTLQFSVGVGRNPQDIAIDADGDGWVPCYDEAVLLKVDPVAGTVSGSFSTASFADADGLPETAWTVTAGDVLGIVCQRLDRNGWWGPADYSQILLFDTASETWIDADPAAAGVQGVVLAGTNPSAMPEPYGDGRRARVATTGWFGVLDGGIETVDLLDGTTTGFQVTEAQLGGDIIDFVTVSDDRAYAVVSDASFITVLVSFDPRDGTGVSTVTTAGGYDFVDLAFDGVDQVYLCDRTSGASGVRVFDAASGAELTTSAVGVGRPPFMVALPDDRTTATVESRRTAPRLDAPYPNPANPRTTVSLSAAPEREVRLDVFDLRGRRLNGTTVTTDAAGRASWSWSGLDLQGRPAPSGTYRVRAVADGAAATRTLTLVR